MLIYVSIGFYEYIRICDFAYLIRSHVAIVVIIIRLTNESIYLRRYLSMIVQIGCPLLFLKHCFLTLLLWNLRKYESYANNHWEPTDEREGGYERLRIWPLKSSCPLEGGGRCQWFIGRFKVDIIVVTRGTAPVVSSE